MSDNARHLDRRTVLESAGAAIGGLVGVAGLTGSAAAYCTVTNGSTTVFEHCGSGPKGLVDVSERGCIQDQCYGNPGAYYYMSWDGDGPDGWVHEDDLVIRDLVP